MRALLIFLESACAKSIWVYESGYFSQLKITEISVLLQMKFV